MLHSYNAYIIKVLKSNDWTLKELAYNKLLIIKIWAIYFIGTSAYLLKLYTGVGLGDFLFYSCYPC
jgi:hypothetical protein